MKAQLLAVSTAIHEFFILHPGVLEAKKKPLVLSGAFCIGLKEALSFKFIRDASSLVERICEYLAVEENRIITSGWPLTRSQKSYISILQDFRKLNDKINNKIIMISFSKFIDKLTTLEIEVRKAVATFDVETSFTQGLSVSQPSSRRNTISQTFSVNDPADPDLALTIFDPSAEPTLQRKVSWKENIAEEHAMPVMIKPRCFSF